jgi:hypothetical protein
VIEQGTVQNQTRRKYDSIRGILDFLKTIRSTFYVVQCTSALHHLLIHQIRLQSKSTGETLSFRLNLELIVAQPVLHAVKNYEINIPEICNRAILNEIERLDSITGAVARTTASRDMEIKELKEQLIAMREKLVKAEAALASQKHRVWHR